MKLATLNRPLIRRCTPPSPARGEGKRDCSIPSPRAGEGAPKGRMRGRFGADTPMEIIQ